MRNSFISLFLAFIFGCSSLPPADGPLYSESHLSPALVGDAVSGKKLAIASGGAASSRAGIEIEKAGGNIVDVAVASAFTLAVERPQSAGLGGGGFFLLQLNDPRTTVFVDFRETAPRLSKKDMYLDAEGKVLQDASKVGVLSVATPGFVAGLFEIHKKWGKLPWKKVLGPSIRLAKDGFAIYGSLAEAMSESEKRLWEDSEARKIFFKSSTLMKEGEILVQKDLGKTLKEISESGRAGFYQGPVAKELVTLMKKNGGILSREDLEGYKVEYRQPIPWTWKGYVFLGAPPPSSGGILFAQMTQVLSSFDLNKEETSSAGYTHLLSEVMKRAYADRSLHIGDPAFHEVPVNRLMSEKHAAELRAKIDFDRSTPSKEVAPLVPPTEDHGTTQVSVIDDKGSAISATFTINTHFGSGVIVPGTGIILNNEMDDFSAKAGDTNYYGLTGGDANSVAPLKRPVSSMSPTLVLKEGVPVLAIGGAGGSRILSGVYQVMMQDLVAFNGDLKKAVYAPRMHHQWLPDKLYLEKGYSGASLEWLQKRGHDIEEETDGAKVQAVGRSATGELTAVSDPRDFGGAAAE